METCTASTAGDTPTDNYIHYDAENNVLTLHNATIKKGLDYNESIQGGTYINGSAIGVFNQNGDAELTITLEGTNTIAEVGKGIFVLASSASTGSSNLTIHGRRQSGCQRQSDRHLGSEQQRQCHPVCQECRGHCISLMALSKMVF